MMIKYTVMSSSVSRMGKFPVLMSVSKNFYNDGLLLG